MTQGSGPTGTAMERAGRPPRHLPMHALRCAAPPARARPGTGPAKPSAHACALPSAPHLCMPAFLAQGTMAWYLPTCRSSTNVGCDLKAATVLGLLTASCMVGVGVGGTAGRRTSGRARASRQGWRASKALDAQGREPAGTLTGHGHVLTAPPRGATKGNCLVQHQARSERGHSTAGMRHVHTQRPRITWCSRCCSSASS